MMKTYLITIPRIKIVAASSVTIAAKLSGILPLTDDSGSLSERSHLLGGLTLRFWEHRCKCVSRHFNSTLKIRN